MAERKRGMIMRSTDRKRRQQRIGWLQACVLFICGALLFNYFRLQVWNYSVNAARNERQVTENRALGFPRGALYDRNGTPLAISLVTQSVAAWPDKIKILDKDTDTYVPMSKEEVMTLLDPYVSISREELSSLLDQKGYTFIDRSMDPDKMQALREEIKDKKIEGFDFTPTSKRYYPNGNLAAQLIGFVGVDNEGLAGLEKELQSRLKGDPADFIKIKTDANGKAFGDSVYSRYLPNKAPSVTLTIDATVQYIAERALDKAMEDTKPVRASVIIMDPKTGDILAMANRPTFAPNDFSKGNETSFNNAAVTNMYEPGSTFKPLIAAAALDSGKWTVDRVYNDVGYIKFDGAQMRNWNGEGYGKVTLLDILKYSINTGMAKIGTTTGKHILIEYLNNFGFFKPTNIEFPGEADGLHIPEDDMSTLDTATMSIGQSVAVTPLQMVQAFGALANKGVMMKPHIIKNYLDADGNVTEEVAPITLGTPVKADTVEKIVNILEKEVSEGGGAKARIPGYAFAGKTGTAEKLNPAGGYLPGHYIASFIGFGPVADPQFVVLVVIDDPSKGSIYGGQIAAPVFHDIVSQLVRYYQLTPSIKEVGDKKNGPVTRTLPKPTAQRGTVILPDFTGYTYGQVRDWLHEAHLYFKPEGTGTAISQDEPAGTTVDVGSAVTVYFTR